MTRKPSWWNARCQRVLETLPVGEWIAATQKTHDYDAIDIMGQEGVVDQRWVETGRTTQSRDSKTGEVVMVPVMRREFRRRT